MVGVIAIGAAGFVVPHSQRIMQPLPLPRQREIHHHRGATGQRGARAGLEIIRGISAHEGHFQMRMRVNPAGHDIAAGGVQHLIASQILANLGNHAMFDLHIRLIGQIGCNNGSTFDDFGHSSLPVLACGHMPRGMHRHYPYAVPGLIRDLVYPHAVPGLTRDLEPSIKRDIPAYIPPVRVGLHDQLILPDSFPALDASLLLHCLAISRKRLKPDQRSDVVFRRMPTGCAAAMLFDPLAQVVGGAGVKRTART